MRAEILHGDCRELLRSMPDNSIDSLVTDPPYELNEARFEYGNQKAGGGFMNQWWDGTGIAFDVTMWREVFRVLKPGAWGVVFGACRRIHRVTCALEDAGFVIRAQGAWVSAQVFPKSLDASKAIDAKLGAVREVVGKRTDGRYKHGFSDEAKAAQGPIVHEASQGWVGDPTLVTAPATPEAAKWNGYGTALKTMEPWVLVRKPMMDEAGRPLTLAENLMKWGCGALNIDGCRIGTGADVPSVSATRRTDYPQSHKSGEGAGWGRSRAGYAGDRVEWAPSGGRWPSALICSDLDLEGPVLGVEVFGAQDDDLDGVLGPYTKHFRIGEHVITAVDDAIFNGLIPSLVVCPKVGPAERDLGCDDMAEQWVDPTRAEGSDGRNSPRAGAGRQGKRRNTHPTIKPISLMRHLIRLVTPAGGKVLDPFTGSAAGGMAAVWEGMDFVGCELTDTDEQPFVRIGRARLAYALRTPPPPIEARVVQPPPPPPPNPQLGLVF